MGAGDEVHANKTLAVHKMLFNRAYDHDKYRRCSDRPNQTNRCGDTSVAHPDHAGVGRDPERELRRWRNRAPL